MTMRRHCSVLSCATMAAACMACANEEKATQVVVVVTAEPALASSITHLDIASCDSVSADSDGRPRCVDFQSVTIGPDSQPFPMSFAVTRGSVDAVLLLIGGYREDTPVVEQKLYVRFVADELHRAEVKLMESCADVICNNQAQALDTCYPHSDGQCVPVEIAKTQQIEPRQEFDSLDLGG